MSQSLTNKRQIHISSDQVRCKGVFEHVGMPFLEWQRSGFSDRLKHAEKLRPVEPSSFLACEQVVRAVRPALTQPSPQGRHFT